ncbi:dicarboxylate transporter 2.1, chloroplastic-like [Spinacia oleracea]|uniref:Dicarboxylate transporter 2.1, chloroplastic-like n=1 Tax=Spinacia oleracea TaxID=3562 RepID=A0ABM3RTD8_SPIOL|nr:dicarboxylate transporter 2.1, chloroplastic-like [Spinacia oleracea]
MDTICQEHSSVDNNNDPNTNSLNTPILPTRTASRFRTRFPNFHWDGVKPIPFVISITTGLIIRFAIPKPDNVSPQAWTLLSIFMSTISGLVFAPLPVGAWSFVCLTATLITNTLSFKEAFSAMTNEVIWLIVVAFFFSRGFVKTGLGDRVATCFIKWMGRRTVGLAYGLVLSEALICPAIPSSTARAGGVFSPVIKSVAVNNGSMPFDNKSGKKIGSYLVMAQLQMYVRHDTTRPVY